MTVNIGSDFIDGQNISLRALSRENLTVYTRWVNTSKNRKYIPYQFPTTIEERTHWLEAVEDDPAHTKIIFEIWHKADGLPVGYIQLHDISWIHRRAEIGILIGEYAYWGKGIGQEAVQLISRYAFEELNIRKVKAIVEHKNVRSRKIFEKIGFTLEATLKAEDYFNGEYIDTCIYTLFH
ncbi:GNAT family N-acetyltransferase [Candidatus Lokiarchaeum ossiferum]|uniref:GNAT family N-acetyltransferase n=1 Tax=Candidatus Lokiarchaeum ossiferum TaxID=2951803 RepID=UPI00352C7B25